MNRLSMKSYFDKKRKNRPVHMRKLGINKGLLAAILLVAMLAMSACGSNENERVLSAADLVEAIPEGDAHAIDVQAKEEQPKNAQEKDAQTKDVQEDDINSGAESTTNQKSGSKKNCVDNFCRSKFTANSVRINCNYLSSSFLHVVNHGLFIK